MKLNLGSGRYNLTVLVPQVLQAALTVLVPQVLEAPA